MKILYDPTTKSIKRVTKQVNQSESNSRLIQNYWLSVDQIFSSTLTNGLIKLIERSKHTTDF